MDYQSIIDKYYGTEGELRHILMVHSRKVADKALEIAGRHPELGADRSFIEAAAMLHDIGIILCDAKGIHCYGTQPYICHGTLGAEIMMKEGYPAYARVCERHTGTGLTAEEIIQQNLPLEPRDLRPETIEEQIICYADKFFSKTHPDREKTYEQAAKSLSKFGPSTLQQFATWHKMFG